MVVNTERFEKAVETFENSGLSHEEARSYVARVVAGMGRQSAADALGKSASAVDTQKENAKDKARLPEISKIERNATVTPDEDRAVVLWFDNGAKLRYRADEREGTVYEETFLATDSDSVYKSMDVALDPSELDDAAFETVSEYINNYRDDPEDCREWWTPVWEAITGFDAR